MQNLKTAILTISEAINFELVKISYLITSKIPQNGKFVAAKMVIITAVFELLKCAKIDFQLSVKLISRKILFFSVIQTYILLILQVIMKKKIVKSI